ncbi:MAG TPA: Ig-like domain-containing protein [Chitinophagaceae bacterium]|jgi:hypothetical protein|nr:Ig-like domain-containing protein [Chitinophagaceae bacterium]
MRYLFMLLAFGSCAEVVAQTVLPLSTIITENFNGLGTGSSVNLPANWKMSSAGSGASANWGSGTNVTVTTQAASSGTPVTGGRYNWGTSAGTDRAPGFMTDGSYTSPNAILAYFRNGTGSTATTITISFQLECYRINTGQFSLLFYSSADGSTWVARPAGDVSVSVFGTGTSAYQFATPKTTVKTVAITGLSIPSNGDIYFRWVFTSGTNSQGIGLDNVSVLAGTGTPTVTASLQDQLNIDVNNNSQADQGDGIRYKATIRNTGADTARNLTYNNPTPVNTTLVAGSVKTSALARDDNFSIAFNTPLVNQNVLANDFGLPAISVSSFGPASGATTYLAGSSGISDNGGVVTVNSDGSFTYTPANGFSGLDRFTYTATTLPGGSLPDNTAIVMITVGSASTAITDNYNCIGNVSINPNAVAGVLANDVGSGKMVVAVNGDPAKVGIATLTTQSGNLTLNADGSFLYDPPKGYEGGDQFNYTIDNGFSSPSTVTVNITVSGMIWFIANGGAAGDGRLSAPFNSIAAFQTLNDGSGSNPAANDHIFIYENAAAYPASSITLLQNQKLAGQDASSSLATITGYAIPSYSTPLPATNPGGNSANLSNAGTILSLSAAGGNVIQGITLSSSSGSALSLSGAAAGTHSVTEVIISASGTSNGVSIATASYNGTFNYTSGSITSSGTGTAFTISGNTANITCNAGITQTGNGSLIAITNHSTGTVLFQTGSLTGSNGNGMQFSNADGIYNFNGTNTLNGGDAGIDILNGSGGTFVFSTTTSITNPSGPAFNVDGTVSTITASVTYNGHISQNTSGQRLININTTASGLLLFQTGVLSSGAAGSGVNFNAVNGNVTFSNGVTLGTSPARMTTQAVTITGGTGTYNLGALNIYVTGVAGLVATNADGTINCSSGIIDAAGSNALTISGPAGITTLGMTLTTVNSTGGVNNISVVNTGGVFTPGNGALSGASGTAFNVNGGNATISYSGSITKSTAGRLIDIQNRTFSNMTLSGALSSTGTSTGINISNNSGGIIDLSGTSKILNTGTNSAVTLNSNTGATVSFTNGNLSVTTSSGTGIIATGGGIVNVTGTGNIISSQGGVALNVSSTTIGSGGLVFQSISANGGANGIILSATGTTAGLTVTGLVNQWGSGGTVRNMTGGDGATAGNGIYLNNTKNVSLSYMLFNDHQNNGIFGTGVRGFSITRSRFTGNHGTSNSGLFDESVLRMVDLGGAVSLTNSYFSGGAYNTISIENITGTAPVINSLLADTDTLTTMQGSTADVRGTALLVHIQDGSITAGTIQNSRVDYWWGNAIHVLAQVNATASTITINNNFCDNTNGALAGAGGIAVAGGPLTYTISNNTVRHTDGTAISADRAIGSGLFTGTISGNIVGVSGDVNSGSRAGSAIFSSHTGPGETRIIISNNIIRQVNGSQVIWVLVGDDVAGGGSGTMKATVTGNNIQEAGNSVNNARMGILVTNGRTSGDTDNGCFDIGGAGPLANTITNFNTASGGVSVNRLRINLRFSTTARFPGYAGGTTDDAAMGAYLSGRNVISNFANANNVAAGGSGYLNTIGGLPCQ